MRSRFRLPGPTPLPPEVMAAMQRPMIPHRGPGFKALHRSVIDRLKLVHRTDSDVFVFPGSGSAGWEVAIVNLFSPGDAVLCAVGGEFGERFHAAAVALGLDARRIDVEPGRAVTPAVLRAGLEANPGVRGVFLTHNETATGVTNPIRELAALAREVGALVVVDAVSSASALPLEVDAWGLDFVLSGSQKAWMCPPGALIAAVGPRCWDAYTTARYPRFFWDLQTMRKAAAGDMTPTTPPLSLYYALDAALDLMLAETVDGVWARHARLGERTRAGARALGLALLAEPGYESDTVTAIVPPGGAGAKAIVARLEAEHGVVATGGQGAMADTIVRIGHMGWCDEEDIDVALAALAAVLRDAPEAAAGA